VASRPIHILLMMLSQAPENALAESLRIFPSPSGIWKHREVHRTTFEGCRSVWDVCMFLLDLITFFQFNYISTFRVMNQ